MFIAKRAIFFILHAIGVLLFVLGIGIVLLLAFGAGQCNILTRHNTSLLYNLGYDSGAHGMAAFSDGKSKLLFKSDGRD